MDTAQTDARTMGYDEIVAALDACLAEVHGKGVHLQDLLNRLGDASYCFVCILLSVMFVQPFSLGPLTMASGVTFAVMGWQMLRGHSSPRLPKKMGNIMIQGKAWEVTLGFCKKVLKFLRRFTRKRMTHLVSGAKGIWLTGLLIFLGGILLALPCFNLPMNNTFPALMILCAAIALLEQDGFFVFVSIFWGVLTLLYFGTVGVLLFFFGSQVWGWMRF